MKSICRQVEESRRKRIVRVRESRSIDRSKEIAFSSLVVLLECLCGELFRTDSASPSRLDLFLFIVLHFLNVHLQDVLEVVKEDLIRGFLFLLTLYQVYLRLH